MTTTTDPAGDRPTDDELWDAFRAALPVHPGWRVTLPGLRAVADLVDARYRAELDQARKLADLTTIDVAAKAEQIEEYRAELDRLRTQCAADAAWARQVEDGIAKLRGDLRDARAELVRLHSAFVNEHTALRLACDDLDRLRAELAAERDRADKAVTLAGDLLDELVPRGAEPPETLVPYFARLAALRGDTGEGRATTVPVEPSPLLLAALDDAARYGAEGAGAVDLIHRHELEALAHRLRTARPDTTTEDTGV